MICSETVDSFEIIQGVPQGSNLGNFFTIHTFLFYLTFLLL